MRDAPEKMRRASMNARRTSGLQYKYQVRTRPTPHLAKFCNSRALGLQRHQRPEHATAYRARPRPLHPQSMPSPRPLRPQHCSIASPSTSTTSPRACRRLRPWSTPSTSTASSTLPTVRFADAPDHALRSAPSFPSL
jgi:hypothetical protein